MTHICFVVDHFPVRSETFIREQVIGLNRRGHRVSVLARGPGPGVTADEVGELASQGVEIVSDCRLQGNRFGQAKQLASVVVRSPSMARWLKPSRPWHGREAFDAYLRVESIRSLQPDVVHIHFGNRARPLQQIGLPCPVVVTWHGYDANVVPRMKGQDVYEALFAEPCVHTASSRFLCDRLRQLGAREEKTRVIPMGVDVRLFEFHPREIHANDPLRIVSVGRLDEMKGHQWLIRAVAELLDEGESISLRIIGDGPLRSQLETQINSCGRAAEIRLLGPQPSAVVAEEMQSAHLFALTGVVAENGRVETQGVVFAEAQACGLPVIGSVVGGVPESIVHGETGLLCPPRDVPAVKDAIRSFRAPGKIAAFGRRGREFVESHFTNDLMLDRLETVYRSLLAAEAPAE
ncbi:MAG: glycosyltransferase [Planctomycetales bacterium]|nr:glycosyltransferase [Planctomycetales bacterium]